MDQGRLSSIDILRSFAIILIILAHVKAPYLISELRSFDVPLIIFISGLVFYRKSINNYRDFIITRTKRLIIPVWLFFALIYVPILLIAAYFNIIAEDNVNLRKTVETFLLLDGYGYVWIIRVFLLIMLVTPFLLNINKWLKSNISYFVMTILLFLLQNYLSAYENTVSIANSTLLNILYNKFFLYLTGYSLIFMIGIRMRALPQSRMLVSLISLILLSFAFYYYHFQDECSIAYYKFPPRGLYIIYGICISSLLWINHSFLDSYFNWKLLKFIGQNTIWIYLWHTPFVLLSNRLLGYWFLRYMFVFLMTLLVFYMQYMLVKKINKPFFKKYLIG